MLEFETELIILFLIKFESTRLIFFKFDLKLITLEMWSAKAESCAWSKHLRVVSASRTEYWSSSSSPIKFTKSFSSSR